MGGDLQGQTGDESKGEELGEHLESGKENQVNEERAKVNERLNEERVKAGKSI